MNVWRTLTLVIVAAITLALRCVDLDARPIHNDEGVNGVKLLTLWQTGDYKYDAHEFHGPTLSYLTLPFLWLSGASDVDEINETTLRLLPVVLSAGLILLLLLLSDALGQRASLWAAIFTAISPAFVFYSRYYIHETLLIFFTMLTLAAGWRFWQSRNTAWAIVCGGGVGLMYATKETFVFALAAMLFACVASVGWDRWRARRTALKGALDSVPSRSSRRMGRGPIVLGAFASLVVSLLFFTSFLTNPNGPLDSLRTYPGWIQRAGGESFHIHGWSFYFERLLWFQTDGGPIWSELPILAFAIVGAWTAFFTGPSVATHGGFARFLTFYTAALALIYTVIPYKTPWCLLGFWHGAILLAGIGAGAALELVKLRATKAAVLMLLICSVGVLAFQSWRAAWQLSADPRNPYVYAQTSPNILELVKRVEALAEVHPDQHQMTIKVMASGGDYWPLPWYLRSFEHVGWWDEIPADPAAPVVIASPKLGLDLSGGDHIMTGIYALRPGTFLELHVETNVWWGYLEMRHSNTDAVDE